MVWCSLISPMLCFWMLLSPLCDHGAHSCSGRYNLIYTDSRELCVQYKNVQTPLFQTSCDEKRAVCVLYVILIAQRCCLLGGLRVFCRWVVVVVCTLEWLYRWLELCHVDLRVYAMLHCATVCNALCSEVFWHRWCKRFPNNNTHIYRYCAK